MASVIQISKRGEIACIAHSDSISPGSVRPYEDRDIVEMDFEIVNLKGETYKIRLTADDISRVIEAR